jgi:hypothetical protein
MQNTTKYAYYSEKQENCGYLSKSSNNEKRVKYNIYLVKKDGLEKEVKVTEVMGSKDSKPHAERFDDSVYMGEVVRWVRCVY